MSDRPSPSERPDYTPKETDRLLATYLPIAAYIKFLLGRYGIMNQDSHFEDILHDLYLTILKTQAWDPSNEPMPYLRARALGSVKDYIRKCVKRSKLENAMYEQESTQDLPECTEAVIEQKKTELLAKYPELRAFKEYFLWHIKCHRKKPSVEQAAIELRINENRLRYVIMAARNEWKAVKAELERE